MFHVENLSATSHEEGVVISLNQDSLSMWGILPVYDTLYIPYLGILPYKNDTVMTINLNLPSTYTPGWANLTFNIQYGDGKLMEEKIPVIIGDTSIILFSANFDTGYASFSTNHWDTTSSTFISPPYSITDSKTGPYSNNDTSYLLTPYVYLPDTEGLYFVSFYTKYSLEPDYDFVYFQIQEDGSSTWNTLETFNDSTEWHRVNINLTSYRGKRVRFRFYMITDYYVEYDGIYIDNFMVYKIPRFTSSIKEKRLQPIHNKGGSFINSLKIASPHTTQALIRVYNNAGQLVKSFRTGLHKGINTLKVKGLREGKYTVFVDKKRYNLIVIEGK